MRIGIDLGGSKIEIVALTDSNTPVFRKRLPTPQGSYRKTVLSIVSLIQDAEETLEERCTVGLGIPGSLSPQSGLVKNANSTCLIGQDLKGDIEQAIARPIRIANDADCFTLSEASDGAGAGEKSVFGIIVGTGVGGGLVINQQLISGPNALCGEWGHNPLPWQCNADKPLPTCYCGKKGCIETFLSVPGFEQDYYSQTNVKRSAEEIAKLALTESHAADCLDRYIDRFARSVSTIINILDPDVFVVGGGMSNIDALYSRIEKEWQHYVFSDKVTTPIRKARHGDSSGVRGAAWLWPLTSSPDNKTHSRDAN